MREEIEEAIQEIGSYWEATDRRSRSFTSTEQLIKQKTVHESRNKLGSFQFKGMDSIQQTRQRAAPNQGSVGNKSGSPHQASCSFIVQSGLSTPSSSSQISFRGPHMPSATMPKGSSFKLEQPKSTHLATNPNLS